MSLVTGTVTLNGEPVKHGYIIFIADPVDGKVIPPAHGIIGLYHEPGAYSFLSTFEDRDGAAVGTHRVCIHVYDSPDEHSPDLLPAKFNTATTLRRTVTATAPGEELKIDFDLWTEPKPATQATQ